MDLGVYAPRDLSIYVFSTQNIEETNKQTTTIQTTQQNKQKPQTNWEKAQIKTLEYKDKGIYGWDGLKNIPHYFLSINLI